MNYDEALNYIHSLRHFEKDPSLDRIRKLMNYLGNPQDKLNFIHVAGTNGKGSVCHMLYHILTENGKKVGLYTSPYIVDFRERFQTSNGMISKQDLAELTLKIKTATDECGISLNEFEFITALAFCCFYESDCDIVVLETGLGGRFDSTNIIKKPLVSVITSISLDHTEILGNTVLLIAEEKAGIIKPGCPIVTPMTQNDDAFEVIMREAAERNSDLYTANVNSFKAVRRTKTATELSLGENDKYYLPLIGDYQIENLSVVLECVRILNAKGFSLDSDKVKDGISHTVIPARMETVCSSPTLIIDGAHNPDGIRNAFSTLEKHGISNRPIVVYAGMKDKDYQSIIEFFGGRVSKLILTSPDNIRAENPNVLKRTADAAGVEAEVIEHSDDAVGYALNIAGVNDTVFVCGSFYLAGEVRRIFKN